MAAVCSIPRLLPLLTLVVSVKGVQAKEFQLQLAQALPPLDLTPPQQTAKDEPTGRRSLTFRHLHVPLRPPRFVTETTTIFPFITAQKALSYLTRFDSVPRPRSWPIRIILTDAEIQGTETKTMNVGASTAEQPGVSRGANWPGSAATSQEAGREKWRVPGWTDASKADGFYNYDKQLKAQVNSRYSRDVAHTDGTWRDVRIKRNKGNSRRESVNGGADVTTTHDRIRATQSGNDDKQKQIGQRKTKLKYKKEKKASKKRRKDKKKKAVSSRRFSTASSHDQVLHTSEAGSRTEGHTTTLTVRSNFYLYGHTSTGGADSPITQTSTGGADSPSTQTSTGGADSPSTQTSTGGADSPSTQTSTGGADSPSTQTSTGGADSPSTQTSTDGADSPSTQTFNGGADNDTNAEDQAKRLEPVTTKATRVQANSFDILSNANVSRAPMNSFDILSNANVSRAPMKNEAFGNYLSERLCGLFNKKYVRTNIGGRCE